jgi:hypothetical protein
MRPGNGRLRFGALRGTFRKITRGCTSFAAEVVLSKADIVQGPFGMISSYLAVFEIFLDSMQRQTQDPSP